MRIIPDGMELVQLETFSFKGHDGRDYHWLVTLVQLAVVERALSPKRLRLAITDELYEIVLRCNGVDESVLPNISEDRLRVPVLVVAMPEGTHVLIDGSHRLVESYRRGRREINAFEFTLEQLEPYELRNL